MTAQNAAVNLIVNVAPDTNYLAGQSSESVSITVAAVDATITQGTFSIHIQSAEGASLDLPISVTVKPLTPNLVVYPGQMRASMLRGAQTIVQFAVVNQGGAASGSLTVGLPSAPWLSLAMTNPLPALAPGATNIVTLKVGPGRGSSAGRLQRISGSQWRYDRCSDAVPNSTRFQTLMALCG